MIDYARRRRIKLRGTARLVEGDANLLAALAPDAHRARDRQAILFSIAAWRWAR